MGRSDRLTNQADTQVYDESFFIEQEQPNHRKQVNEVIRSLAATTGKSFSLLWRTAFLKLEDSTGFRVPDNKKRLDAIDSAGLMPQLLQAVRSMSATSGDLATEINDSIPDYVPYESDRSRWKTNGTGSCSHEWGVFSTVLEDVCLLVQCVQCGAYGKVTDPTAEEWQQAFHAPSNPYHWPHGDRVELLPGKQPDESKRHIKRVEPTN